MTWLCLHRVDEVGPDCFELINKQKRSVLWGPPFFFYFVLFFSLKKKKKKENENTRH